MIFHIFQFHVFQVCLLFCHWAPLRKICHLYLILKHWWIPTEPSLLLAEQSLLPQAVFIGESPWWPLWPFARLIPVLSCCSCTGELSTWGQCSRCFSAVLSRVEGSHLSTFPQHFTNNHHHCWSFFARRAHCWPMFNLLTIRMPRSLSCQAAFQLVRPQLVLMWRFIPPQVQDLAFFLGGSCQSTSPTCQHPSEWQHTHQPLLPTLYHLQFA